MVVDIAIGMPYVLLNNIWGFIEFKCLFLGQLPNFRQYYLDAVEKPFREWAA